MATKPQHSELSGSTAHRWISCPGSIRLNRDVKKKSSPAAREGTTAHALGEQILRYWMKTKEGIRGLRARFQAGFAFRFEDHGEKLEALATDDMLDAVFVDVEHTINHAKGNDLYLELHVSLERLVRDNMYGTADRVVDKKKQKTLVVTDYKNGFLPVHIGTESDPNAQLMYYAAGVFDKFDWMHRDVELNIIQPRSMEVEPVQTLEMTAAGVREWVNDVLYPAAYATDQPDAPLVTGGWCRFCDAQAICPAQANLAAEIAGKDFASLAVRPKDSLPAVPSDPRKLAKILRAIPILDAYFKACEIHALELIESGTDVPGFKSVSKRSNRAWPTDDPAKLNVLIRKAGYKHSFSLMSEKMKSPAQMEKEIGKDIVNKIAIKPDTGTTLAVNTDKRDAIAAGRDFEELL